jgi:Tfp pilus assembly protein PilF
MKQQVTFAQAVEAANRGDAATARTILKDVVRQDPKQPRAWMLLAEVAKTPEYALECIDKVLAL